MNLFGWDTVYAVDIETANLALGAGMSEVLGSMQRTISGALGTYDVSVTFGAWQITVGGSNQLVNLMVPIAGGAITPLGGQPISLAGYVPAFQLSLRLLAASEEAQALVFDLARAAPYGATPEPGLVVPMGFVGAQPDPSVGSLVLDALAQGLVAGADQIRFAFASINLVPPETNGWLAPKNMAYSFFTAADRSYLALLSTAGDPAALTPTVDPALVTGGAQAGYAFSLALFYEHYMIPAIASGFPGQPVEHFAVTDADPPAITLISNVNLEHVEYLLITYKPKMTGFTGTSAVDELRVSMKGRCDVYLGLNMDWSCSPVYAFRFDQAAQTLGFGPKSKISVKHDIDVPWYYFALSATITGIAKAVAELISDGISDQIAAQAGYGMFSACPPATLRFAGVDDFTVTRATLDGAVALIGTINARASTSKEE